LIPNVSFDPGALDPGNILDNLDGLLGPLQSLLQGGALGKVKLPLIGRLDNAAGFIADLKDHIRSALQTLQVSNPRPTAQDVQHALAQGLQALIPGGNVVLQSTPDGVQFDMLLQ